MSHQHGNPTHGYEGLNTKSQDLRLCIFPLSSIDTNVPQLDTGIHTMTLIDCKEYDYKDWLSIVKTGNLDIVFDPDSKTTRIVGEIRTKETEILRKRQWLPFDTLYNQLATDPECTVSAISTDEAQGTMSFEIQSSGSVSIIVTYTPSDTSGTFTLSQEVDPANSYAMYDDIRTNTHIWGLIHEALANVSRYGEKKIPGALHEVFVGNTSYNTCSEVEHALVLALDTYGLTDPESCRVKLSDTIDGEYLNRRLQKNTSDIKYEELAMMAIANAMQRVERTVNQSDILHAIRHST